MKVKEPGLKQAPVEQNAKEKNINGKKNLSKIIRQTDLTEEDMIVLANKIGRKIDPTDEKSFRKMSLKKKIERAIEGIIPTYLGFMFNQLVAKIGPGVGMESDPDIMKKPVAGKKKSRIGASLSQEVRCQDIFYMRWKFYLSNTRYTLLRC